MTIKELLNELSEKGVKLWADGEQLRIRAPKGVITPDRKEAIAKHKPEILWQLRQNNFDSSIAALPVIVPQPDKRYEPFPLTDIQYAFWVGRMGVLELGHVANHGYYEIAADGLNIERLNRALNKLIRRHDMLRAIMLPEGLQQVFATVPPYEISVLDLRGEDEKVVEARIEEIRALMSHQVLPTDKWPLFEFRATLFSSPLGAGINPSSSPLLKGGGGGIAAKLHISYDLQIFDAWSMMRLFEEWFELYHNPEIQLKPLELTFRDYVLAEQRLQESELYENSKQYWLNRIDSLPPAPELPLAINPSSLKNYECQRFEGQLDKVTWQQLKRRAGELGLTPSAVLLAAFAEVLAFWSKSPKFTMNLALFNRVPLHPQVNDILGDFTSVTLLAVGNRQDACSTGETETFTARALRLQRQLWQDLEHRYFSGVRVMREINRRQGRTPTAMPVVFTSAIGFDALGQETSSLFKFGELEYAISQASQVWMDCQVSEQNGKLVLTWDAVAALFPEGIVADMFEAFWGLIKNLADPPPAPLEKGGAFEVASLEKGGAFGTVWDEVGRQHLMPSSQLLQRENVNATENPVVEETLYGLFAAQVASSGNEVAVIASDRSLTYQELYDLSRQLGAKLQQSGAAANKLVAVVMEKGWEQIVAVLGVLAAGAAYVPINPNEPRERLQYLLENSEAEIVLSQSRLADVPLPENLQRIDVDRFVATDAEIPPPATANPDDLAYVIYTSGSTGLPKGVMLTHRNVVNVVVNTNRRFQVGREDRILAVTALKHDLSVYDIFGILSAGGAIVLPEAARVKDPGHWLELIQTEGVTLWNSVPPMMEMLVEYAAENRSRKDPPPAPLEKGGAINLRLAILGGDWLPLSLPQRAKALANGIEILSIGGPTETTIWNIGYLIKEVDPAWKSIPYGQPMANSKYYILNEALEDCPTWVPGQMYCAGVQLAKGYWRNEEKTKASFITHPRTGERIYATGDLGRYLPDGNIEFLGRVDFQIKIRGHRVETGEIEAALTQHSAVKSAVVTAVGEAEKQRLVAYIIPASKPEPTIEEIGNFLKEKLPEYMVPSAFIFLEKFPLSANGKIDRRALPQEAEIFQKIEVAYVPPQTNFEQTLAKIWQEVLGLEKVGINENFFDLGGNSLQVTKIYNELRRTWPKRLENLSLVDLFKYPTIGQLAAELNRDKPEKSSSFKTNNVDLEERINAGKNRLKQRFKKAKG